MFTQDPRTHLVGGYEDDARRGRELAEAMGQELAGSYEAVIETPGAHIVAVASAPCDKPGFVEKAAEAGKAVFLNKPMAANLDGARRIAETVEGSGVPFVHDIPMVRGIPVYARLLEEVAQGARGPVLGYHHHFGMNFPMDFPLAELWPERLDPPAKSGGGEMCNMGCYALEYAAALLGPPQSVRAKRRFTWDVYKEANVENYGQIALDYGTFWAFLEVGKQQLPGDHGHSNALRINFEHETLYLDATARQAAMNHVAVPFESLAAGAVARSSLDQLVDQMEEGTPVDSGCGTGLLAMEMLMAAYRSALEGGASVGLPLKSGAHPLMNRD
jgi:predicted dehydrogenase